MLSLEHLDDGIRKTEADSPEEICDYCGVSFALLDLTVQRRQRGKFCSKGCQKRAAQNRITARLALPPSKRSAKSLRFSSPLYFN
jgi:hypothetical protein